MIPVSSVHNKIKVTKTILRNFFAPFVIGFERLSSCLILVMQNCFSYKAAPS